MRWKKNQGCYKRQGRTLHNDQGINPRRRYTELGACWVLNVIQYSCLENPMDGRAWWAAVHGVAKSRIRLSDFTLTFHFHALEKEMATHSSILAWRIPGTEEPSGLLSVGSHRVGHDWRDLAAHVIFKWRWEVDDMIQGAEEQRN